MAEGQAQMLNLSLRNREQAPSHISERFEIQQIRQINVPEYAGIIYLNLSHCPLGK